MNIGVDDLRIIKASGQSEPFDVDKLLHSLLNAGADREIAEMVAKEIAHWVFDGVTSRNIYRRAFALMRKYEAVAAAKYRLKEAIFKLGPTGYPFEQLCGRIFRSLDFHVEVGVVVEGRCLRHEMDVIATKDGEQWLCECKYTQDKGKTIGIQVPLYVHSRVEDIVNRRIKESDFTGFRFVPCVVTNNRFSEDCIRYAECVGMKIISWSYPFNLSLKGLIEKFRLFPVMVLLSLTLQQKQWLLERGYVCCIQLLENSKILDSMGLSPKRKEVVLAEVENLCR